MNNGTSTQVAVSLILGSRIFLGLDVRPSSTPSLVEPSSMNTSICGMTLKAMRLGSFFGSTGSEHEHGERVCSE